MRYQFFLCTCLFCHLTVVSSCSRSSDVTVGLSVSPAYLARGADEELTFLSDARLDGGTPSLELLPADGLTLSNVQRVDDQTVTCTVMVASDAPLGRRIARLRIGSTSGETELQVVEAIPPDTASDSSPVDSASEPTDTATETDSDTEDMSDAAVSVSPQSIFTNSVQSFILTGTDAHFSESSVITFPQDSGLVVLSSSYESSLTIGESYLHFTLEAHETADTGWVIGTVSSPIGNGVEELFFTLQVVAAPTMVISPTSGYPGTTVPLSIHGFDTHFSADMPSTLLLISPEGQGVEIDLTAIYTTADIAATVYIDEDAAPGSYTVSATTSTTPADEVVEAAFTVLSVDTDTHTDTGDTDTSTDTQDTDTAVCNDFDVVPSQIPVGSFQKSLRLEGSGGINWVSWDRSIVMAGESEQFYLNDPESDPTEKCYVSTPQDITCSITAGLFVTPGAYTITVTSGGVTTCGTLTVTGDDVATMAIPAGLLPQKNTYEGELSTTTNRSDFYSFNAAAGDMVVFHAVSLDRSTMDPILRLIDSTGAQWLYFVDNETSGGGIDARFAHFFAEAGTFHLEVGPSCPATMDAMCCISTVSPTAAHWPKRKTTTALPPPGTSGAGRCWFMAPLMIPMTTITTW